MSFKVDIIKPRDVAKTMFKEYKNGPVKGTTTYNSEIDNAWTWRTGEANIWTGYANEGKSAWLRQLCLIKALEENRKFIFASPEDMPANEFFADLVHTLAGESLDKDRSNYISEEKFGKCFKLIEDKFIMVDIRAPENTLENILETFSDIIDEDDSVLGCIIDPILKFTPSKNAPDRDDRFAGYIGMLTNQFVLDKKVSLHLVMHQLTPKVNNDGLYPKPNMYYVKGGGSWSDGFNNILYVQRPYYAKDKLDTSVAFGSQKIKRQKLTGIPQDIGMLFDRRTNRYTDLEGRSIFNFDKFLKCN